MKYYKKLIGNRIYLSPKGASEEEIQKFTEWMNDFEVTDYTGRSGQIVTLIGEKEYLEDSARESKNRNFNIIELNENKLIGTLGLEHINWIERSAVLGIFIGDKDFRSNGYGTEAINLLLEYGFIYPVNYGYIPNTVSGDGEEIDCYVLGIFEPIDEFEGKCIAVIHRTNDNDDKLIIVPKEKDYSDDAIRALTEFQERFFESIIIRD